MNHKVSSVSDLYADAKNLYDNCVVGSSMSSADSLLSYLENGINNLKENWKGIDAGVQINSVIRIYNSTVEVRNALAQLAVDSSKIAAHYRAIQAANSNAIDELTPITFEEKGLMSEYEDTQDVIDITIDTLNGKANIDTVVNTLDDFKSAVQSVYGRIMDNWTVGSGRDEAVAAFEGFSSHVAEYQIVLTAVSNNIAQSLRNYGLLQ